MIFLLVLLIIGAAHASSITLGIHRERAGWWNLVRSGRFQEYAGAILAVNSSNLIPSSNSSFSINTNNTSAPFSTEDMEWDVSLRSDNLFYGLIGLGSPAQKLKVIFDTGSDVFWVRSTLCISESCQDKSIADRQSVPIDYVATSAFNPEQSTTFQFINVNQKGYSPEIPLQYGTGSVKIIMGQDNLQLDTKDGPLLIKNQQVGLSREQSYYPFGSLDFDGIIGLSFGRPGLNITASPIFNMKLQNLTSDAMFGYWVNPDDMPGVDPVSTNAVGQGEMTFGGYDESKIQGEIRWIPVSTPTHWNVDLLGIYYGDENLLDQTEVFHKKVSPDGTSATVKSYPAIMDSGTTALLVPKEVMKRLMNIIGGFRVPYFGIPLTRCANLDQLLPLRFRFKIYGSENIIGAYHEFSISPRQYASDTNIIFGHCALVLTGKDLQVKTGSPDIVILGETFLKNYYSVWDMDNKRIGLASLNLSNIAQSVPAR